MTDAVLAVVLKNTFSIGDVEARLHLMGQFFEHFFYGGAPQAGERAQLVREYFQHGDAETRMHAEAVALWGPEVLDVFEASTYYALTEELKKTLLALPRFVLYVPAHLSHEHIDPIGIWIRASVNPNLLLDVRFDASAVGGCMFAYSDVLHDFSLSYFVKKQRAELVRLVHSYG